MNSQLTSNIHSDLLEISGVTLERVNSEDIAAQCYLTGPPHYGMATASGLNDYDYYSLSEISLGQRTVEQVQTVSKIPIPAEILEHLKHIKCHCMMGLFPEIGRAWLTIDCEIYMWAYEQSRDVAYYDGLNHVIVSVGIAKPRPGVFIGDIKYLLILTTAVEIVVLGITFLDTTKTIPIHNQNLHTTVTFEEMQFISKPIFILNTDNVAINEVRSSKNGRIFLGGKDGYLYELAYQAESSWLGKRCKKINHSQSIVSYVVPSFLKFFSENDPIVKIVIDESRQFLYVLTEKGSIEAWSMGHDYNGMRRFARMSQNEIVGNASNIIKTVDPSVFKTVKSICPLSSEDSSNLHLIAVTQSGVRLFFATMPLNYNPNTQQEIPQGQTKMLQQQSGNPSVCINANRCNLQTYDCGKSVGLYLYHVRLPPGYTPNTNLNKPKQVHSSQFIEGTLLLVSSSSQDQDILWSISVSPTSHFTESISFAPLDGIVWSLAEIPGKFKTKINAPLHRAKNSNKVVLLTNQGVHIIALMKPIGVLQQLLRICNGPHHQAVKAFFQGQTKREACVTCLLIACSEEFFGTNMASWAIQAFFLYGGEPSYQYTLITNPQVDKQNSVKEVIDTSNTTEFNTAGICTPTPLPQSAIQTPLTIKLSSSSGFKSHYAKGIINDRSAVLHSARHDGLYAYIARLLRPIWRKLCVDNNFCSTVSQTDCNLILLDLYAIKRFLDSNFNELSGTMLLSSSQPAISKSNQTLETCNAINKAQDEEKRSLNALIYLIKHTSEVISLWKVLCEHHLQTLVNQLSKEDQVTLCSCTFQDLTLSCFELHPLLIRSLINSYLKDNASVNSISKKLREVCPNLYRHEDAISSKATELLMDAKNCETFEEKSEKLRFALELCKNAAPTLPLQNICQQFILARFYEGVLEMSAMCAAKVDPDEIGIRFYKNEEPNEDREGFSAYSARMASYMEVRSMLDQVYQSMYVAANRENDLQTNLIKDCDMHLNKEIIKIVKLAMHINDPLLHITVYEWLIARDMISELLTLTEPSLGEFLRRNVMRNPGNLKLIDLLWKYYEKSSCHSHAARILDSLAGTESKTILLKQRVEYLARAVICMRNDSVGCSTENGLLLKELEDKLEVARIQKYILDTLSNNETENSNILHLLRELNYTLYDITTLYEKFADPYNLLECKLTLLKCSQHNDPLLIESIWSAIINKCIEEPGFSAERYMNLFNKIGLLVKEFQECGRCFPLAFIIKELEIRACRLGLPEGAVAENLIKMNLDIEILMEYYFRMVSMNERIWTIEGNEWQLIQSSMHIVTVVCNNMDMWHRSRVRIIGKAQDIISICLNFCYQKPNTENLKNQLKGLQCRLQRNLL